MRLPIVHHSGFQAELAPGHRFPMPKYRLIAELLVADGLLAQEDFIEPEPAEFDLVAHAHDPRYVGEVFRAAVDPVISKQIGFAVTPPVAMRARLSSGSTLLAARIAMETGIATSTAGGSHHAKRHAGAGFCVFNDVAVAASAMLADGTLRSALVFDCDVHQGDGTAEIFRFDDRVKTVSIHSEKNFPTRKEQSDIDVGLPDRVRDEAYLEVLDDTLQRSLGLIAADIVFYNAGVDPHEDDRLGRLALTSEGIRKRDRMVIARFRERGIPVVCVQGGGYSKDPMEAARRHTIVHHVAAEFI